MPGTTFLHINGALLGQNNLSWVRFELCAQGITLDQASGLEVLPQEIPGRQSAINLRFSAFSDIDRIYFGGRMCNSLTLSASK